MTGAASYVLGVATAPGGPYTTLASGMMTGYVDAGLTNGSVRYYTPTAVRGSGTSRSAELAIDVKAPKADDDDRCGFVGLFGLLLACTLIRFRRSDPMRS